MLAANRQAVALDMPSGTHAYSVVYRRSSDNTELACSSAGWRCPAPRPAGREQQRAALQVGSPPGITQASAIIDGTLYRGAAVAPMAANARVHVRLTGPDGTVTTPIVWNAAQGRALLGNGAGHAIVLPDSPPGRYHAEIWWTTRQQRHAGAATRRLQIDIALPGAYRAPA